MTCPTSPAVPATVSAYEAHLKPEIVSLSMELAGTVTTGLGKGEHYIGMDVYQDRFNDTLGFYPFPGTLNIEVDASERSHFQSDTSYQHIDAPEQNGTYMSAVTAYPVQITSPETDHTVKGALLDIEITDHPDTVAEIIAPINIREKLGVTDGDRIVLEPR